jgi:hypothetical protein
VIDIHIGFIVNLQDSYLRKQQVYSELSYIGK